MNPARHFYLYAKGHYEKGELEIDLRKILAHYCAVDFKALSVFDVNRKLLELTYQHINHEHKFMRFMYWLVRETTDSKGNIHYGITESCLIALEITKVSDIPFELGEADPTILPLKEN